MLGNAPTRFGAGDEDDEEGLVSSLGGSALEDERKAREQELLRGLDALASQDEDEQFGVEKDGLMSRYECISLFSSALCCVTEDAAVVFM